MTDTERIQTVHLERAVIGALITQPAILRSVQEECMPSDFQDLRLGDIYRGITGMVAGRVPVDVVTVTDRLLSWDVRGVELQDLAQWQNLITVPSMASYYARLIRERAVGRGLNEIAQRMMHTPDAPGLVLGRALDDLRDLRDKAGEQGNTSAKSLREVLDVPETDDLYDWTIPDLLERRDRLVLTGGEGGGKSTFLRQICVLSAAGVNPFRFSPMEPIKVLVIDAENSEVQWRRAVRAMADTAAARSFKTRDPRDWLSLDFVTKQMDITRAADQGRIHRLVEEEAPDMVMIGPLYRLVPRAIKDDDDAAPVLAALDAIRDHGVTMLIEAHAGHATSHAGERDLRPRGSSALLGWPEFGMGIRRDKTSEAGQRPRSSLVRWRGDRDRRSWPTKLMQGTTWPWEPTAAF